jgi:hypothetical protein
MPHVKINPLVGLGIILVLALSVTVIIVRAANSLGDYYDTAYAVSSTS